MVGNVDKPESTVKPVTPIETGVELIFTCGDIDSDKSKCGNKIRIILPIYKSDDDLIYLKNSLKKTINWETINNYIDGTFNLSSGKITKTIEIFDYVSNIIGYKKPPVFLDKREGDIFGIEIDNLKSKSIGWSPKYNLKSGLENTVKFLMGK